MRRFLPRVWQAAVSSPRRVRSKFLKCNPSDRLVFCNKEEQKLRRSRKASSSDLICPDAEEFYNRDSTTVIEAVGKNVFSSDVAMETWIASQTFSNIWSRFPSQHDQTCRGSPGSTGVSSDPERCSTSLDPPGPFLFYFDSSFPDVPDGIQEENGIKYKCQVYKRETAAEDQQWASAETRSVCGLSVRYVSRLLFLFSN